MIAMDTLRDPSRVRKYECGTIFGGDGLYVILRGKVAALEKNNNKVFAVYGPGDFFGEAALLSENETPAAFWAISDVDALPIKRADAAAFLASEPAFTFALMKGIYRREEELEEAFLAVVGKSWTAYRQELYDNLCKAEAEARRKAEAAAEKKCGEPEAPVESEEQPAAPVGEFALFPEGHAGGYALELAEVDNLRVCELDYRCPICGKKFSGLKNLSTKLVAGTTDNDLRRHYKGIEPVYYEVVTCPDCLYSAFSNIFDKPDHDEKGLLAELKVLKKQASFRFGTRPDTEAVFAGYYLALFCAPKCFSKAQMIEARLLHRLSWMYHDCGDEKMAELLSGRALEKYMKAYLELDLPPEPEAQLCVMIGELNFRHGNIGEAKNFYYKAKMNSMASAVLRRRAENRLDELKELEKNEAQDEPGKKRK